MIGIDFKIDEDVLAEDLEELDIPSLDESIFVSTIFIMPVRIRIDDIDLFEFKNDPWRGSNHKRCQRWVVNNKYLRINHKKNWSIIEGPGDIKFNNPAK